MADVLAELPDEVITARPDPSAGRVRLTPPICTMEEDTHFTQFDVLATLGNGRHLMMGDDPRLPKMSAQPRLADFFRHRFVPLVANHLLQSARLAEKAGLDERIVMACLLHDIAMAGLITSDHAYPENDEVATRLPRVPDLGAAKSPHAVPIGRSFPGTVPMPRCNPPIDHWRWLDKPCLVTERLKTASSASAGPAYFGNFVSDLAVIPTQTSRDLLYRECLLKELTSILQSFLKRFDGSNSFDSDRVERRGTSA